MPDFTKKEINYLCALIDAEKETHCLLRGFRKPNREEQDANAEYNRLKDKLKSLIK
jgi:hypothetical protein